MKIFSLMLFSEQTTSGVDTPAAAEQEISEKADGAASGTVDTGVKASDAEEHRKAARRRIYDEFIRANKDFFTEDTQKIISLRLKDVKDQQKALEGANCRILDLQEKLDKLTPSLQLPDPDFTSQHPDFTFEKELDNPIFKQVYNSGASVKSAYYAAHFDDILKNAVSKARRDAIKATVDTVRAHRMRVKEAATLDNSSLNLKRDVSKLTKAQRAELARRASAGEDIAFN